MSRKILCFGNPYIKQDSIAIRVCEILQKQNKDTDVEYIENTFQLIDKDLENCIIIDVVQGIDKIQEVKVSDLKQESLRTAHDFDLGFFLKLKSKDKKIKIIGIPQRYGEQELKKAIEEIKEFL